METVVAITAGKETQHNPLTHPRKQLTVDIVMYLFSSHHPSLVHFHCKVILSVTCLLLPGLRLWGEGHVF